MSSLQKKTILRFAVIGVAILGISALVLNCDAPASPRSATAEEEGETRLVIGIYGALPPMAFDMEIDVGDMGDEIGAALARGNVHAVQGIEALLLSVYRIDLRGPNGWQRLPQEDLVVDILAASRHDPVILSNVSVEPGWYSELRLVLNNDNQIRVNGQYYPLRIPSGTSSGLKLKGDFEIPRGRLFNLNVELDTARSVSWNQGTGHRLHPVLNISTAPHILGIFRGNLTIGGIGGGETLIQLFEDGTARARSARFPRYTIWADYNYNSVTRILSLDNISLSAPGRSRFALRRIMRRMPSSFNLPIRQWSLDNIIAIDALGVTANLFRVNEFNFSSNVSFTEFTVNVEHPDLSRLRSGTGWYVLTEIEFIDTGMPTETVISPFVGGRATKQVLVCNNSIQGTSTRVRVTSFLFRDFDDIDLEWGLVASMPTPLMASGSRVLESTSNSWRSSGAVFRLPRDTGGEFTVSFNRRMNIRMDHRNFTNNTPIVSWDPYPGANGYLVVAIIRNDDMDSGGGFFVPAFHYFTMGTSVTIDSELISFTPIGSRPAQINQGDFIRVEVYALDGSGYLNTVNRTGALFRDTLTIVR